MSKTTIAVLPFGEVPLSDLELLSAKLKKILDLNIIILPAKPLPISEEKDQFDVAPFMKVTRKIAEEAGVKYHRILGVTLEDLYTPGLNFIFGQAEIEGKICVISLARLKYSMFWLLGPKKLEPQDRYISRMTKEAVHELGHTFGLRHCPNKKCVMHFSNSLEDTDYKSETYCRKCRKQLQ